MVDFHRLKNLGTDIIGRAGDIAEQAKDKVGPLAEQAKDKVVPLAEQARDKVGPLAGKAKGVAAKGVDKAAGGLDSATGHKYHDKIGGVVGSREKHQPSAGPDDAPHEDVAVTTPTTAVQPEPINDVAPGDTTLPAAEPTLTDGPLADEDGLTDRPPTPADMPPHPPADSPS